MCQVGGEVDRLQAWLEGGIGLPAMSVGSSCVIELLCKFLLHYVSLLSI